MNALIRIIIAVVRYPFIRVHNLYLNYQLNKLIKEANQLTRETAVLIIKRMNAINLIHPYWKHGTWCFTDTDKGLSDEPFVSGADKFISFILMNRGLLPEAEEGFNLIFSENEFPEYDVVVEHIDEEGFSGNWYQADLGSGIIHKLWLCPALLKYFDTPPKQIYAKFTI